MPQRPYLAEGTLKSQLLYVSLMSLTDAVLAVFFALAVLFCLVRYPLSESDVENTPALALSQERLTALLETVDLMYVENHDLVMCIYIQIAPMT